MHRIACTACLALFVVAAPVQADGLKELLAQQEAVVKLIKEAEPGIVFIVISRSEDYARIAKMDGAPPPKYAGELGEHDPSKSHVPEVYQKVPNLHKLDLANINNVPESYGSGVVIEETKGLILTSFHLIGDATKIYVKLPTGKGCYADIYAADPRSDLAVLRLIKNPGGLKVVKIGDANKAAKGQFVISLANLFASGYRDGSPSASFGIISNIRRRAPGNIEELVTDRKATLHHHGTLLQTDVRLNAGCTGGALLDLKGELIGLTTATASLVGSETPGGFAVPMDTGTRRIVEMLKAGQEVEYGFLGVQAVKDTRDSSGIRINHVQLGTPADRAGLKVGDVILKVDGKTLNESDDLFLAVGMALAGNTVKLEIQRGSETKSANATLAKFYVAGKVVAANQSPARWGLRVEYLSVQSQMSRLALFMGQTATSGVMIREVLPGSAAEKAGIKPLDVITHLNGRAVHSVADYLKAAKAANETGVEISIFTQQDSPPRNIKIN